MIEYIFWICAGLIGYVYFGYPFLLVLINLFHKEGQRRDIRSYKTISIIIVAYNEKKHISEKIENVLTLEYPTELIEIIVGSDGSTDGTDEIVKRYVERGVRLVPFRKNRGKTMVQNDCVAIARGEIIIFMDAASLCNCEALKNLLKHFEEESVGCVAGKIVYTQQKGNIVESSQGLYWKYEQLLKKMESNLGSLVGVDGPLYAIRKKNYIPLRPEIISDLISPLLVRYQGYKVVFEPEAIASEEATTSTDDEFRTRKRVVLRGLTGLFSHAELLNFLRTPFLTFQITSHKIMRWLVGFYFIGLIISNSFLVASPFYRLTLYLLILILLIGLFGSYLHRSNKRIFLVTIPYYFMLVNFAAMVGVLNFLMGKQIVTWIPKRN